MIEIYSAPNFKYIKFFKINLCFNDGYYILTFYIKDDINKYFSLTKYKKYLTLDIRLFYNRRKINYFQSNFIIKINVFEKNIIIKYYSIKYKLYNINTPGINSIKKFNTMYMYKNIMFI